MATKTRKKRSAQHTPGPWVIVPQAKHMIFGAEIWTEGQQLLIGGLGWTRTPGQVEANARLIAAAPDLLAACEGLLHMLEEWDSGFTVPGEEFGDVRVARAAVAKATQTLAD